MSEGETLRAYLKKEMISQQDFADSLGISRQALHYHLGKEKVDYEFKEKIAAIGHDVYNVKQKFTPHGVPVYALEATAGNIEQVAQDIPEKIEGYISLASFRDCIAFLYVKGESMYPTFKSGDLVGVCPVEPDIIQYGNPYLIVTKDNQRMIKFIRAGMDEEHLILRSKNKEFDDIPMKKERIVKLYRVKGPIRDDWQ